MALVQVSTTINGDPVSFLCEPRETLLDVLRDRLGLTGSKEGCASGDCGACSVMLDGRLVCACLVLGAEAAGRAVSTIEGMADGATLHPLQQKFLEHGRCNAGCARRASWWRPRPCWRSTRSRPRPRCATGWPATCAAAPAMTRSSGRCSTPPSKCEEAEL